MIVPHLYRSPPQHRQPLVPPPARRQPPPVCAEKSIIWNDQISVALILSLYSVWHSLQLQDRESSRQCVLGTALFLEDAVCRRMRKETWLLLVCFLSLSAPRGSYYGQYLWAWLVCGTDCLALQGSLLQHGQSPQEGDWPLSLSHCLPLFSGLWIDTVP